MDPSMMMMLASVLPTLFAGVGGNKEKHGSTYRPEAMGALDQILQDIKSMKGGAQDISQNQNFQTGENWLQSMFNDQDFFKNFEAPAMRNFQEQTVPDLANRFASMGSGGALGSTGFRNQLAREGSNLQTNLAAMRGGMQQQAIPQLMGYAQQPFQNLMSLYGLGTQPTQNTYQGASAGPFSNVMGGFTGGAAQGFGNQWGQNMANQWGNPSTQQGNPVGGDSLSRNHPGQYYY